VNRVITIADPLDLDALRIRHEFLTVPDLRLSPVDVAALLNTSHHHAAAILDSLVSERFLFHHPDGFYSRRP
jgi:hypothetical protein